MKEVKLQEICHIEKGKQIDTSQLRTDSPYKYINGGIKESGYYHEYNTDSEAVLVSEGGASCGYVNYANEKFWCGCHCYKLTESKTLAKYLYYALKGNQDKIMELRSGAAMPNIKKEVFKNMSLLVDFDKNNQQAIVETLDCIQKAINNKTDELSSLDELVKSRFIEMFGDPILNVKNWEIQSISNVCEKILGGGTPSKKHPEFYIGSIPWVTPKDMKTSTICDSIDHINEMAIENSTTNLISQSSVLMVIRSGILKHTLPVAINSTPVTINQDMKAFILGDKILPEFLLYCFKAMESDILGKVRCVTADNIDFKDFLNRQIIIPPIELQNEFAEFVKLIDKSKFVCQFIQGTFYAKFARFRPPP